MVGTWATGLSRAAFEEALDYAKKRVQGGKPLVENPNVQRKLFDMFRKVEASRQLCRAAFIYNWSFPTQPEKRLIEYGEAAKTFATQVSLEVTSDAIQIHGGVRLLHGVPCGAVLPGRPGDDPLRRDGPRSSGS
jgi:alkylation response protein AidB-like acyl-CoA dehydrogenase